jgi:hypothetical protein
MLTRVASADSPADNAEYKGTAPLEGVGEARSQGEDWRLLHTYSG